MMRWGMVWGLTVALLGATVQASDRYVRAGGLHRNGFTSWEDAATNIQAAVDVAQANETVWVTNGTYVLGSTLTISKAFAMTLRSVNGRLLTLIDGNRKVRCLSLSGSGVVVDDFTVTNGFSAATGDAGVTVASGAALLNSTVTGNLISNNWGNAGVGVSSGGVVSNCLIVGNTALSGKGTAGVGVGGLVVNCVITNNNGQQGGASVGSGGTLDRCRVVNNYTPVRTAGAHASAGGTIRNCLFAGNSAAAGGLTTVRLQQEENLPAPVLQNCTLVDNAGAYGFYIYMGGRVENCVVSHNGLGDWSSTRLEEVPAVINSSCMNSDLSAYGTGNIRTADPRYVNRAGGDYRLATDSPCIDAGVQASWMTNATDLAANLRIGNGIVDMGAYEFQHTALGCAFTADTRSGFPGLDVRFTSHTAGTNTDITTYAWDIDHNGTPEYSGSGLSSITHEYPSVGSYTVALTVQNAVGESDTFIVTNYIKVGPAEAYVRKSGTPVFPYGRWDQAATNIQTAVDAGVDGTVVWVGDGLYSLGAQVALTQGITLGSLNGRDAVTLDGRDSVRCLYLAHSNAVARGLRIQRGKSGAGGGVYMKAGVVADSTIVSNRASGAYSFGGGVYCFHGGSVSNCTITANKAEYYGGAGIALNYGGTIVDSVVSRNYSTSTYSDARSAGAGIRAYRGGLVRNCLIEANERTQTGPIAPGIWVDAAASKYPVTIESCTVVRNKGSGAGDGLYMANSSYLTVRNCIFAYNVLPNVSASTKITYSCAPELTTGTGNITNAPAFMNPGAGSGTTAAAGDYTLQPTSACIDKGINQTWMIGYKNLSDPSWPRIWRIIVDMGCYEWHPPQGTVISIH